MNHQWLIIGSFGAGNLGDDAILAGILEELFVLGHRKPVWVAGGNLPIAIEHLALPIQRVPHAPSSWLSLFNIKRTIRSWLAFKRADRVIVGGGGLFTDQESVNAPKIWAAQTDKLRYLGRRYDLIGHSLGPLKEPINRDRAKRALAGARWVQVRDALSAQWASDLGRDDVSVGVDWALPWLMRHRKDRNQKQKITLILRKWPGVSKEALLELDEKIKSFAERRGLTLNRISLDQSEILETSTEHPKTVEAALQQIAESKLVISMRLHGALMGLSQEVPTLALSYSPKVENTLKLLKVGDGLKILRQEEWGTQELDYALEELLNGQSPKLSIRELQKANQSILKRSLEA